MVGWHTLDQVKLASLGGLGAVDVRNSLIRDIRPGSKEKLELPYEDLDGGMRRVVLRPQLQTGGKSCLREIPLQGVGGGGRQRRRRFGEVCECVWHTCIKSKFARMHQQTPTMAFSSRPSIRYKQTSSNISCEMALLTRIWYLPPFSSLSLSGWGSSNSDLKRRTL